jgi:hypothetical protein
MVSVGAKRQSRTMRTDRQIADVVRGDCREFETLPETPEEISFPVAASTSSN